MEAGRGFIGNAVVFGGGKYLNTVRATGFVIG